MSNNLAGVTHDSADQLYEEIVRASRANDYKTLLRIDDAPGTPSVLDALPKEQSRQASAHLRDARLWRARRVEKAKGKLDAAESAIDGLDLPLARGLLRKLDSGVLVGPELERYDQLLLEVEARAMEIEDIESHIPPPPSNEERRKPFWRR